ncbi:MAG: hypothetical protein A2283_03140 [Lentisphaerae bacterium RIFOXYA12_FULL_48_11]|nr:MAG: hypothetical protein A2283_03140 [Lentisphaerae bacterium RIFOXYA12_FULL_48_11]
MLVIAAFIAGPLAAKNVQDESSALFDGGKILRLKIEITPEEVTRIKADNRPYVRCTVIENDKVTYNNVGVKLKGAAGSFREFDDRPALTLNSDKFSKKQSFHGLDKFHLNNSVQDESYLNELICAEIFRTAGYPAPRVTHARVWLNGRDVGLYVLKEGFDSKFLKRHFPRHDGNLYDGGFVQDIDASLEKDEGKGSDDRADLYALALAARDPDPEKRWALVNEYVDIDTFVTFMALERMTCHWDGYSMNMNNYRVYFDPARGGKVVFLPHGMDQMFGDPGMGLFDQQNPLISSVVLQSNEGWKAYRKRVHDLLPIFSPADRWLSRVDDVAKRLQPVIKEISEEAAKSYLERIKELKEHIAQRADNLKEQDQQSDPEFLAFDDKGIAGLTDWYTASESDGVKHEEVDLPGNKKGYSIDAGTNGQCVASWRRKVLLGPGVYQLNARCQTKGVVPLDSNDNSAAGIRVSHSERNSKLLGTATSTLLAFGFKVVEDRREVELVLELKARRGKVIFEADTLVLVCRTKGRAK